MATKSREAGYADDDDAASVTSSFVSVGRASPVPSVEEPPPYSAEQQQSTPQAGPSQPQVEQETIWTNNDPRSTSTASLVASVPREDTRRHLLLIYVHGFVGNETSFQSFPAHVHNLLTVLLADSHAVYTKIYPRYRTKKALQVATSEFSQW